MDEYDNNVVGDDDELLGGRKYQNVRVEQPKYRLRPPETNAQKYRSTLQCRANRMSEQCSQSAMACLSIRLCYQHYNAMYTRLFLRRSFLNRLNNKGLPISRNFPGNLDDFETQPYNKTQLLLSPILWRIRQFGYGQPDFVSQYLIRFKKLRRGVDVSSALCVSNSRVNASKLKFFVKLLHFAQKLPLVNGLVNPIDEYFIITNIAYPVTNLPGQDVTIIYIYSAYLDILNIEKYGEEIRSATIDYCRMCGYKYDNLRFVYRYNLLINQIYAGPQAARFKVPTTYADPVANNLDHLYGEIDVRGIATVAMCWALLAFAPPVGLLFVNLIDNVSLSLVHNITDKFLFLEVGQYFECVQYFDPAGNLLDQTLQYKTYNDRPVLEDVRLNFDIAGKQMYHKLGQPYHFTINDHGQSVLYNVDNRDMQNIVAVQHLAINHVRGFLAYLAGNYSHREFSFYGDGAKYANTYYVDRTDIGEMFEIYHERKRTMKSKLIPVRYYAQRACVAPLNDPEDFGILPILMVNPRYSRPTPNNTYCDDELGLEYEDYGLFDDEYLEDDDSGDDGGDDAAADVADGVDGDEDEDNDDGEDEEVDAVVDDGYDEDEGDDNDGVVEAVVDDNNVDNNAEPFNNYVGTFHDEFQTPTSSTDTLQIATDASAEQPMFELYDVRNQFVDSFDTPNYATERDESAESSSVIVPPEIIEEMDSELTEDDVNLFNARIDGFDDTPNYAEASSSVIVPPEIIEEIVNEDDDVDDVAGQVLDYNMLFAELGTDFSDLNAIDNEEYDGAFPEMDVEDDDNNTSPTTNINTKISPMFSGLTNDDISSPSDAQISPGTSTQISPMLLPVDFMQDDTYNDAYMEAFDPEAFARRELAAASAENSVIVSATAANLDDSDVSDMEDDVPTIMLTDSASVEDSAVVSAAENIDSDVSDIEDDVPPRMLTVKRGEDPSVAYSRTRDSELRQLSLDFSNDLVAATKERRSRRTKP